MADFAPALALTLVNEGGFEDHSATTGEVVNMGITLQTLRSLGILKSSGAPTPADIVFVENLTQDEAGDIYRQQYWDKLGLDAMVSQEVANKVFDLAVNTGGYQATIFLQTAMRLPQDGDLGPLTMRTANASNPEQLLGAIRAQATDFYEELAEKNPLLQPDLAGWLKRLNT
jgi:lysozyme family protein